MNLMQENLELMLFESSMKGAQVVMPSGVREFIVDWEYLGKHDRQSGFDTEITPVGSFELADVSKLEGASVWCRINRHGPQMLEEIQLAISAGAKGIFLPMVTRTGEVEDFLRAIDDRCESGILVETTSALACAKTLAGLPLARVYFGLNDFAISRGGGSIFRAVLDGSVERAREAFADTPFGFGGVTAVDSGSPVPCARLIEEMARLKCQFSFLRRSFRKDIKRIGVERVTEGIRNYWQCCTRRTIQEINHDRRVLEGILKEVCTHA